MQECNAWRYVILGVVIILLSSLEIILNGGFEKMHQSL